MQGVGKSKFHSRRRGEWIPTQYKGGGLVGMRAHFGRFTPPPPSLRALPTRTLPKNATLGVFVWRTRRPGSQLALLAADRGDLALELGPRDLVDDRAKHDAAARARLVDSRDAVLGAKVGLERHDDSGAGREDPAEKGRLLGLRWTIDAPSEPTTTSDLRSPGPRTTKGAHTSTSAEKTSRSPIQTPVSKPSSPIALLTGSTDAEARTDRG